MNTTKHDIRLKGRTLLGCLQLVQSVFPADVKLKGGQEKRPSFPKNNRDIVVDSVAVGSVSVNLPGHLSDVDLGGLTSEQRKLASQLLVEQADAFSQNDDV